LSPDSGFKLVSASSEVSDSSLKSVNQELAAFRRGVRQGILREDFPSRYKQILPKNTFVRANETFSLALTDEKAFFTELFTAFKNKTLNHHPISLQYLHCLAC
jgi:hypothetical protein